MDWKVCSSCKHTRNKNQFSRDKTKSDGLQSVCKDCHCTLSKLHYKSNKNKYKATGKRLKVAATRALVEYLNAHPCEICGEDDPIVLTFDHLNPSDKFATVAYLMSTNRYIKAFEEMKKCRVLCANCHTRHTSKQRNWLKYEVL